LSGRAYLVQILLPKESGTGQLIAQDWFDGFLEKLTNEFGGVTSPGTGSLAQR
jgi:hypothetical protein